MNRPKLAILWIVVIFVQYGHAQNSKVLGNASFQFSDNTITVSTGKVERKWRWTGAGFLTTSYKNLLSGKEWATLKKSDAKYESQPININSRKTWTQSDRVHNSDWDLPTKIDSNSEAKLLSLNCLETDDEHFTSNHLLVTAHMVYDSGLELKYLIRVYPNATGIWTAIEVKALDSFSSDGIPEDINTRKYYGSRQPIKIARTEYIPVDFSLPNQRRYWGLYNDPGNRVNTKDMVKEKVVQGWPIFQDEQNTWANGVSIESDGEGLILVKESNKTVNKYGHQTGSFFCTPIGVEVTGWGLKPSEITSEFRRTWGTWSILYSGGEDNMEFALKQFDRIRYPVNLERDMHILIDTWGSDLQNDEYKKIYGRENSKFPVIEKEIKSASDLGIDIVRIDDGWQEGGTMSKNSWHPNTKVGYDANWGKIKKISTDYNVQIGLWAAVRYITAEELISNQKKLGVATWKFDFDKLENWESFNARIKGIRKFIKETNYTTQVSWCPEYDDQRYGWYNKNREYGPMYFQNIQNNLPHHIVYVPYITLRHHWMMSKYYNMNALQCHWQNPSRTNPKYSDAYLHGQSYAAMSAFMSAPSCFMLTQFLKPEERDELREVISVYKAHRKEIFNSFVFPIGDEPNNASWTGFQIANKENNIGYLMIFRELHNIEEKKIMKLKFLDSKKIKIKDLERSGSKEILMNVENGNIELNIPKSADYRFFRYEILDN
ncbi:hypothetical protein Q4Q39_03990 [Flavivirga amylovorans]|uniref:Alpha-galactosidase n=1 Tax=Flavivirga amylovorans TaxID=870486 RepID=A0ABT8WXZ3_9FLAO|nr:hypothetical protein [Flavivirga amylovorans]MDO5986561.1 hypothetical protein [Flavivirga amylovorans]